MAEPPKPPDAARSGVADPSDAAPASAIAVAPRVVHEVFATYPRGPCLERREGDIVLRVYVSAMGSVEHVRVVRSAGREFDAAAVDALWGFKFTPGRLRDGTAVPVWILYKYEFLPGTCASVNPGATSP